MVLRRQWPPELMWRHAQRANQFGAAENAVAAGNKAAYRRQSVTQVSMRRPVQRTRPPGYPDPKCTRLSAIPIHIHDKSIQVELVLIRNSLIPG
jgi:hypothetical protein